MIIMVITSLENERIKKLKKLKQKKYRELTNSYLIEGKHLVFEAYQAQCLDLLILVEGINLDLDVQTLYVTKEIMKVLSDVETPPSIMGVCRKKEIESNENKLLLLDSIQDPGNLGTIIRSAVAFGIDKIYLGENSVDVYNPKTIRSSQGMIFKINIEQTNLLNLIFELKKDNISIIGTKVDGGNSLKTFEIPEKFAIIMGNEANGVSNEIFELCDKYLYIDMNKDCESLNVAVATSIILYEFSK